MNIHRIAPATLAATAFLALICASSGHAAAPDPVASTLFSPGGPTAVCPLADTPGLAAPGAEILVRVVDTSGVPCIGLTVDAFEVDGIPGPNVADAWFPGTGARNITGMTVLGPGDYQLDAGILAGGSSDHVMVKVGGVTIATGSPLFHPMVSYDINADGAVDLVDVAALSACYGGYTFSCDFNFDGVVDLADISRFASHYGHAFPPAAALDPVD